MGFRYGTGNYGTTSYGFAYNLYAGSMSVSLGLSGNFRNPVRRFAGNLAPIISYQAPLKLVGLVRFGGHMVANTGLGADFRITFAMGGTLSAAVELEAGVIQNATRRFGGALAVDTEMAGFVAADMAMGGTLSVLVSLEGDPYLGPFWRVDMPSEGGWDPVPDPVNPWTPIDPVSGDWQNAA